jgi:hypothetical protein
MPRVLLMCLALGFASIWLGCGPDLDDQEEDEGLVPQDDEEPSVESELDCEDANEAL